MWLAAQQIKGENWSRLENIHLTTEIIPVVLLSLGAEKASLSNQRADKWLVVYLLWTLLILVALEDKSAS